MSRPRRIRLGILLALLAAFAGTLAAVPAAADPADVVLAGRVLDDSGAAIPAAVLSVRDLGSGFERVGRTGPQGTFTFGGLRSGRYRITAHARGFAAVSREVEAPVSGLELTLSPAAIVEEVAVVSGSRQEELRAGLATRVEVVGHERIRDSGHETVAEVLREVPGVLTRRGSLGTGGGAGEQIQGIDSRQVLVLLDGLPLVGARGVKRGGVLNLDRQSVARLDRIEVVKGACSTLYGSDAIGGVIHLITREPQAPLELRLNASAGSLGMFDGAASLGFARGRVSGLFTFERHQGDGFDLTPATFDATAPVFRRHDALGKVRYQVSPSLSLTALVSGYWNDETGRSIGEQGPQHNDTRDESQQLALVAAGRLGGRTTFESRTYLARYDEGSDVLLATPGLTSPARATLAERLGRWDATLSRVVGTRQLVQVGAEWTRDHYRGDNRIRDEEGNRVSTGVLWIQDRISLGSRVTATLGARLDRHSRFGSAFSPKAALHARASEAVSLRASYGRGFRAPDLGQLYYRFLNPTSSYQVVGNPDLAPEHADSWQLGADVSAAGGRVRVGLNAFRNEVGDLIDAVSLGFVASPAQLSAVMAREGIDASFRPQLGRLLFVYKNVADVRTQGLEADAELRLPHGFSAGGAYTYLEAIDRASGSTLTGRHRHHGAGRVAWESRRLGVRANLRATVLGSWIAARQTAGGVVPDTRAPGFAIWDLYAARRFTRTLEMYGALDNLTDDQDPNTGLSTPSGAPAPLYRPAAGRTVRIGFRWSSGR